jgi:predicted nucleic-acid-binding protein
LISLDTNVLARAITTEANADAATAAQQSSARQLLSSGQALFVPITVIEELEWVLRGAYEMPTPDVAAIFEDLLAVEHITVDRAAAVAQAIQWYRLGLDFSDALHLAQSGLCQGLASFDTRFAKAVRRLGLKPPVIGPGAEDGG